MVGASLEDREEALDGLLTQLLVVGPLALLLTSVGGYFLAGAALRPVEAMRRQAAEISSERADQRLPLPPARDEIRRLGETLNDMLDRLEEGLARERRFVADASHELRTPLASLRTELELAQRRPRSQAELEDALRSAAEEVERLVRLAEDLLVLARADDGRLPLSLGSHYLREVLDAVAGRFDSRARASGREVEVSASADEVVTGDRARLDQALGNLVDNALRHGAGTVRLEGAVEDGTLELRVSDDGAGFPQDFLPHAFERFSRVDVARTGGGTGLGLAIVDAIARAHGGAAAAANRPGGGAEVTLTLPAEPLIALSSDLRTLGETSGGDHDADLADRHGTHGSRARRRLRRLEAGTRFRKAPSRSSSTRPTSRPRSTTRGSRSASARGGSIARRTAREASSGSRSRSWTRRERSWGSRRGSSTTS